MKPSNKSIVVVGAGASGLMAAAMLAESGRGLNIHLVDKNRELGVKLRLTGGGRCNITNALTDIDEILRRYPRGRHFLKSAMHEFPPQKVREWFEAHGVKLKAEADGRVFPVSEKSEEVVAAFEQIIKEKKVELHLGSGVTGIQKSGNTFKVMLQSGEDIEADVVVLATGGEAYRHTGSTGDGYAFAKHLGHTITPLAPSLSSLALSDSWIRHITGVSLNNVRLRIKGESVYESAGPLIFTRNGISGPAVFALSALAAYEPISAEKPTPLLIDFFPDKSHEDIASEIAQSIAEHPQKTILNLLDFWLPKSLAKALGEALYLAPDKKAAEVPKKTLNSIALWLKAAPLRVIARNAGEEMVTAGGVTLGEVDKITMESKRCPGLYITGELLDVDAFTGGFNLQAAWCTGAAAARAILK